MTSYVPLDLNYQQSHLLLELLMYQASFYDFRVCDGHNAPFMGRRVSCLRLADRLRQSPSVTLDDSSRLVLDDLLGRFADVERRLEALEAEGTQPATRYILEERSTLLSILSHYDLYTRQSLLQDLCSLTPNSHEKYGIAPKN